MTRRTSRGRSAAIRPGSGSLCCAPARSCASCWPSCCSSSCCSASASRIPATPPSWARSSLAWRRTSRRWTTASAPRRTRRLRPGDKVIAFDGTPVSNWTQLHNAISRARPGSRVTITVVRDGKTITLHTTLAAVKGLSGGFLGIVAPEVYITVSPVRAVQDTGSAFEQVIVSSVKAVAALPAALPKLFSKDRANTAAGQVSSVVGLANNTGQEVAANVGWQSKVSFVLLLMAELNIFFGAFNLLPLLPMDGGHVAAIIWERIRAAFARLRGRPDPGLVDMTKLLPVSFSIFAVVIFFSVVLILADIVNPVNIAG